ncbi:C1q-related factor-like [Chelmon rostratus]|uniref:C1q-related factor-like n=1 Tax=Chelmon rostratus TaxID=109905 RepID=UPI001BE5F204|nr:C1q-related factor-like [Chelmon rostratus]
MRATVLLCLLHAAFGQYFWDEPTYTWEGPEIPKPTSTIPEPSVCLQDQASCGCCLMQEQVQRMEWFFNITSGEMSKELKKTKMILDNMRGSRSAFSVALNNDKSFNCYGPFDNDRLITYKHVFINLGGSYDLQSSMFTVPRSGVYSLSVTIYVDSPSGSGMAACAHLHVNGKAVSALLEHNGQDLEDSGTIVAALKLKAGDQVAVSLPKGCVVCDHSSHYNTFTGFLLYATD